LADSGRTYGSDVSAYTFRHEALFYGDDREFLAGALPFLEGGLDDGASILVAVGQDRRKLLRKALGDRRHEVAFVDMVELGRNPSRIIPAWKEFARANAGYPLRGIGEPIWPGRSAEEIVECDRHEALLNLAFEDHPDFWLLCPYDIRGLPGAVLDGACRNHPQVARAGASQVSAEYVPPRDEFEPPEALPRPSSEAAEQTFTRDDLALVRTFVLEHARRAGLESERLSDLVLAVNELAANSMRHGGGEGTVRAWRENGTFLCEVADGGQIDDPLAGRDLPSQERYGGRGLWMVHHLCDLVQVRSSSRGTVVRLHMRRHVTA
jgi:anti-sigma regulatory factor (Ser/Thr protein kinase)